MNLYCPFILKSMNEICKAFGVGRKQVQDWVTDGAPIACEGNGYKKRYSCEALRLQQWREDNCKKNKI